MSAVPLERARELHRQGKLDEAESMYREILSANPRHPDALHLLGVLCMRNGRTQSGIELMERSLQANPAQPAVLLNLARALTQDRRREAALAAYDRALALAPDLADVLYERANGLMRLQEPQGALESYDRLLALVPAHAGAWSNRGNALQDLGRLVDAVASYDRALALLPNFAEACNNRGNALRKLQRFEEALASFEQALRLNPRLAEAHNSCGIALRGLARTEDALAAFARAVAVKPAFVEALINQGNALRELGRPEAALASYERALAADPHCAEALTDRGNALLDLKRYPEALESYDQALRGLPENPDVLANRATALLELQQYDPAAGCLERLLHISPRYDYALGSLLLSRLHVCAWEDYSGQVARVGAELEQKQRVIHPFSMMAVSSSAVAQVRAAELHASNIGPQIAPQAVRLPAPGSVAASRKIRLAYVSADLREHAVSYLLAGTFEHHDRRQFETIAISLLPPEQSAMGARVQAAFDRFVDVGRRSDREIAALMRELEVDVAVDLMGYTHKARPGVFAYRAAPVQVTYLGYPGTLGARCIDYILADEFVIPREAARHYTEQVVYLPECYQANDDRCAIGAKPTRAEAGLPEEGLVLCSFNNSYKLNPPVFDIWMRLLLGAPGSVLWLVSDRDDTRENLLREAAARGVDGRRLVFAGRLPYAQHLGRLGLADLFLDTLPYNAGTTASDALRMGVPVITCAGEAFAARMAASLLRTVGLPELITYSLEEYERKALEVARHPQQLAALRSRLAANLTRSPLFDTARFCRHVESAYLTMHERAIRGEPPASFAVPARD